ncbi:ROK family protein [Vibrio hangzhouensis]|uniref:ROK family protein n=1 Tax=Vibrio hangzhouensis TaxID=462991 RepID=UPI001C938B9B|nr:ROK family protein [Vibrio hangzhouensis]MBY6196143.1 ROK family protein [Vibrio hangzhouensis]
MNEQACYLVLDFGGTSVKGAVMNAEASILERFSLPSQVDSYDAFLESLLPKFDEFRQNYDLKGIAISTCGAVDVERGVIEGASALKYIHNIDIRAQYHGRFGLPVELENDGCCAALAEGWLGAGSSSNNFCLLVLGSGVGGAIVNSGKVTKGAHLHAGEFGYCILRFEQGVPLTYSELASTRGMVLKTARALGVSPDELDGLKIFELYDQGEPTVIDVVEQWYMDLAIVLFNIQYSLDPECILLGGAISRRKGLIEKINQKLDGIHSHYPIAKIRPNPKLTQFGNDANLIGALKHFLNRQG